MWREPGKRLVFMVRLTGDRIPSRANANRRLGYKIFCTNGNQRGRTGTCFPQTPTPQRIMNNIIKDKKGSALVEYGLLIAGVALVGAAAVSIFGHKTTDLIGATAAVLPGAHADDNGAIVSGKLVETNLDADGNITINGDAIAAGAGTARLGTNLLGSYNATSGGAESGIVGSFFVVEAEN